jgi:hypothetical protein
MRPRVTLFVARVTVHVTLPADNWRIEDLHP